MSARARSRRTIGRILVELGRIDDADIERALQYQQERGGYFGEALVALGLVSAEEVGWTLADQFDLPFVRLHPEEIDLEGARAVGVEWARSRSALPILRTGTRLTVVLSDPTKGAEVRREIKTRIPVDEVDLALAPQGDVTALIDAAFGIRSLPLDEWLAELPRVGAGRFGVSERQSRAVGWTQGAEARVPLEPGWKEALQGIVQPFPQLHVGEARRWRAEMDLGAETLHAECSALRGPHSFDWAARVLHEPVLAAPIVSPGLADRVRALRASQPSVVIAVPGGAGGTPDDAAGLAAALLGSAERIFVLADRAIDSLGVPVVRWDPSADPEPLEVLEDFMPEAIVVLVEHASADLVQRMIDISPLLLLCGTSLDGEAHVTVVLEESDEGRRWYLASEEGTDGAD